MKSPTTGEPFAIINGNGPHWTGKVELIPGMLDVPLRRRKPTIWFVNSMSDLFHEGLTDEDIDRVFAVMAICPRHTFQVLTKRTDRMQGFFTAGRLGSDARVRIYNRTVRTNPEMEFSWPIPNVWLGVSVEDQQRADERIPQLLQTPAAIRFLSLEPLLGPVDFRWAPWVDYTRVPGKSIGHLDGLKGIDWVIVGGESGSGARPMHPDWVRSIRDQCRAAGVPFFFKQFGEWAPATADYGITGSVMPETGEKYRWIGWDGKTQNPSFHGLSEPIMAIARVGKKKAGRLLDGRSWDEMPRVLP